VDYGVDLPPLEGPMMAADVAHPGSRSTRIVSAMTGWLGSFPAIILSVLVVLMWAMYLPFVKGGFLNTNYQLLINTTTTIVTFIMVFIIQSTQNRDGRALQTKLDAVLIAIEGDHDHLMGLEDLPEKVIKEVQSDVHDAVVELTSTRAGAG
jgi:low affinity Fe/Cu permease